MLHVPEEGGRDLEPIKAPKDGYSVEYLKAVVHNAKVYIRPLQKNLDKEPISTVVSWWCLCINFLIRPY